MSVEEITELKNKAKSYNDKIHEFILTTSPQIDGFKSSHRKYYEYIVTASGVFAGLTQALLASDFLKINLLATTGFSFFVAAVVIAVLGFRKDIIFGAQYTVSLKIIQKTLTDFSYVSNKFSSNEITAEKYKKKLQEFESKYHNMRNNPDMEKTDAYENTVLEELLNNRFSHVNLITGAFILGLVFVALSVIVPQLTCLRY